MYRNWIHGILGLVVMGVAFVNLSTSALTWTLVVAGLIIAGDSFWRLVTDQGKDQVSHTLQGQG